MIYSFVLNPFPELLSFALLGATLLRVVAGVIFIRYGYRGLNEASSQHKAASWLQLLGGGTLVLGFYTQVTAVVLFFVLLHIWASARKSGSLSNHQSDVYVLLLAICLSLIVTGAGLFGLDLPL